MLRIVDSCRRLISGALFLDRPCAKAMNSGISIPPKYDTEERILLLCTIVFSNPTRRNNYHALEHARFKKIQCISSAQKTATGTGAVGCRLLVVGCWLLAVGWPSAFGN